MYFSRKRSGADPACAVITSKHCHPITFPFSSNLIRVSATIQQIGTLAALVAFLSSCAEALVGTVSAIVKRGHEGLATLTKEASPFTLKISAFKFTRPVLALNRAKELARAIFLECLLTLRIRAYEHWSASFPRQPHLYSACSCKAILRTIPLIGHALQKSLPAVFTLFFGLIPEFAKRHLAYSIYHNYSFVNDCDSCKVYLRGAPTAESK